MLIRRLRARLRRDAGFTVAELAVGAALGSLLLVLIGTFLVSTMKSGVFADGESATINDARNALAQVEKDIRGADSIKFSPAGSCSAYSAGYCIEVGAQTPSGLFETVRYSYANSSLRRELFDDAHDTWGTPVTVIQRVANTPSQLAFSCDTQSSLLKVTVDLFIEPTPHSNPYYEVQTSVRPRNYPSKATCP